MKACKAEALKNVLILVAACVIGYVSYEIFFIGNYFKIEKKCTTQTHLFMVHPVNA